MKSCSPKWPVVEKCLARFHKLRLPLELVQSDEFILRVFDQGYLVIVRDRDKGRHVRLVRPR